MKALKTTTYLAIFLSMSSFIWMVYSAYYIAHIHAWISTPSPIQTWVGIGLLYSLACHLALLVWLVYLLSSVRQMRRLGCIALVTGFVSTIFYLSDTLGFREMLKEIPMDFPNEATIQLVLLGMLTHLGFYGALGLTCLRTVQGLERFKLARPHASTEGLFIAMNLAGVISALIGFGVMLLQADIKPLTPGQQKLWVLILSLTIIAPYCLIAASWLWRAYRRGDLLDEKQRGDINRAGVTAWLVSLPLMFILSMLNTTDIAGLASKIWFPYYLFVTLFVFSVSSLWYFRRS